MEIKLNEVLARLEDIRILADAGQDSLTRDAVTLYIIHTLVEFIDDDKIRSKINEIPY